MSHRPSNSYSDPPQSTTISPPPNTVPSPTINANPKADQIVHRVYVKLVNIVADSRTFGGPNAVPLTYPSSPTSPVPYDTHQSEVSGLSARGTINSASSGSPVHPSFRGGVNERTLGPQSQRKDKEPKIDKWVRHLVIFHLLDTVFSTCCDLGLLLLESCLQPPGVSFVPLPYVFDDEILEYTNHSLLSPVPLLRQCPGRIRTSFKPRSSTSKRRILTSINRHYRHTNQSLSILLIPNLTTRPFHLS